MAFAGIRHTTQHLHVLAADGTFLPDERFVALPPVPGTLLAEGFRRAVLKFLVKKRSPPLDFASWSPDPSLPLNCHPAPDLA